MKHIFRLFATKEPESGYEFNFNNLFEIIYQIYVERANSGLIENIEQFRLKYLCMLFHYYDNDKIVNSNSNLNESYNQTEHFKLIEKYTRLDFMYPFKIFQIGFNKCGTISLKIFFKQNNLPTAHLTADVTPLFYHFKHNNPVIKYLAYTAKLEFDMDMIINDSNSDSNTIGSNDDDIDLDFTYLYMLRRANKWYINLHRLLQWNYDHKISPLFSHPWYVDSFMVYTDFGTRLDKFQSLQQFYFEYKTLQVVHDSKQLTMTNNNFTSLSVYTFDSIYKHVTNFAQSQYHETGLIDRYLLIDNDYNSANNNNINCHYILNVRNVYHYLLSKTRHEFGALFVPYHTFMVEYTKGVNEKIRQNSYINIAIDIFKYKMINVVEYWYLEWYIYLCHAIEYFNNSSRMIIFDIEKDPIEKLTDVFVELKLDKNKWNHHHDTNKKENLASDDKKSYYSTHEPFLNATEYNDLLQFLANTIEIQEKNDANYSEEIQLKTNICPNHIWDKQYLRNLVNRQSSTDGEWGSLWGLPKWNSFWGYLRQN